jgi:fatty acid desaturase
MKSLLEIFQDQIRSKEIWKRVWELNRLKRFENLDEYKKRVSRKITKEDVPAIIVSTIIVIMAIALLSQFFEGSNLTYAILGLMAIFCIVQKLIESAANNRQGNA